MVSRELGGMGSPPFEWERYFRDRAVGEEKLRGVCGVVWGCLIGESSHVSGGKSERE